MTTLTACRYSAQIDAHFAGRSSVAGEAEMRRHLLEGCQSCRRRYQRRSVLARLEPGALDAEQRIAVGLGLARRQRGGRLAALVGLVGASSAVAALLIFHQAAGFQARGPAGADAELLVFRVRGNATPERVVDRFSPSDELAFAYRNGAGKRHLFVFGVDEHRHVFWFSPAWTDEGQRPAAPQARGGGAIHEIEDAAAHRYDGSQLDVYGLFTDRPYTVSELDAVAATGAAVASAGDIQIVHHLRVTP